MRRSKKQKRKAKVKFSFISDAEFETVRERATGFEGRTDCQGRIAAGILLGLHGLRCGEVCGLDVGDLDKVRGAIHVETLKDGEPRDVDLKPRVVAWLSMFCTGKDADEPLLRTGRGYELHESQLQRAWRRLSVRWIGRKVRFHSLRHTAAQRLYQKTRDLLLVKAFLGHRSLSTTLIYAKSVNSVRDHMLDLSETAQPLFDAG